MRTLIATRPCCSKYIQTSGNILFSSKGAQGIAIAADDARDKAAAKTALVCLLGCARRDAEVRYLWPDERVEDANP